MPPDKTISVYFDGEQVAAPLLMCKLTATRVRGRELFSFEFDESWLRNKSMRSFDPDMQFDSGRIWYESHSLYQ